MSVFKVHVIKTFVLIVTSSGPWEKAMAPHSSTLAWKIPWTEEPGRLQTMGLQRVGHDWATSLSLFPFMHWRRKWQPTPVFLPGESQERGSLVGCRLWVAQSRTRLKRLSNSSSSSAPWIWLKDPFISGKPKQLSNKKQNSSHYIWINSIWKLKC